MENKFYKMKVAIIHNNAKTGATIHALMLAKKLQEKMEITFLVQELSDKGVDFSGLKDVVPFSNTPEERARFQAKWPIHVSIVVRIRLWLYRIFLLRLMDKVKCIWGLFRRLEREWYNWRMPLPVELKTYLVEHDKEYDAYIVMGNYNSIPYHVLEDYSHKVILIPLVHLERSQFILSAHDIMSRVRFLAYNTLAEKMLAEKIHGSTEALASIIGCGVELLPPNDEAWLAFKQGKNIGDEYLLYVGRVTPRKTGEMFSFFRRYKSKYNNRLQLLIAGDNYLQGKMMDQDIVYLGFVDDVVKSELIRHAVAVVNPSFVESLSLIVLEAMAVSVPVLVNGQCDVLKQHCKRSGGGIYYLNYASFEKGVNLLISSPAMRKEMGEKGQVYERELYSWDVIVQKWEEIIREIDNRNKL